MNELLSAAALLIGIVGILYGVWYTEISQALSIDLPVHKEDALNELQVMQNVRAARAFPLAVASSGIAFVFLPESGAILLETFRVVREHGVSAVWKYDAVRASFLLVNATSIWLAVTLAIAVTKLSTRIRKVSK